MSDIVLIKYVLVFILISLINMNKIINQNWFKVYPKARLVPEPPGAVPMTGHYVGQGCSM